MDHTLTAAHSQGAIPASSLADYVASLSPASIALLPLLLSNGFNVAIATFSDDLYTQSPSLFPFFFNPPTASPTAPPAYLSGRPLVSALLSSFVKPELVSSVITVALHPDLYTAATPTTSRVVVALPGRVREMMRRRAAAGGASNEEESKQDDGGMSDRSIRGGEREETTDESGWMAETEQRERDDEPSASKTLVPMHMPEAARRIPNFSPPPPPMAMSVGERRPDESRQSSAPEESGWSWCCCFVSDHAANRSTARDARSSSVYNTPAHSPLPPNRPPPLTYQPPPLRIAPPMLPTPSPTSPMPSPSPPPGSALLTPSASNRLRATVREDDIVIEDRKYGKNEPGDKDEEESKERRMSHDMQSSPVLRSINSGSGRPVVHMLPHNRSLPTLYDHLETVYITRAASEQSSVAIAKGHGNPFADDADEMAEDAEKARKKGSNPFAEVDEIMREKAAAPPPPPPPPPPQPRPPPPRITTTPSPPTSNPPTNHNNSSPRSSSSSGSMQSPPSLPANRPALPSLRVSTSHPSTPSGSSTSHQQSSPHTSSLQQPVPPTSAPSSHSGHFFPRTPKGSNKNKLTMPPIPPTPPVAMSPPMVAFVPAPPPPPPPPPHMHAPSTHGSGGELYVNVSVAPASPPPLTARMGGGGGGLALPSSSPSFRPSVSASASSLMLPSMQLQSSAPTIITLTSASTNLNSNTSKHAFYLNKLAALLPPPATSHPLYPLLSQYPPPPYKTAHMQLVRAVVMCRQRDKVEHSGRCKAKRGREADSSSEAGSRVCKCMMDGVPWGSMLLVDDVAENAESALQLGCYAVLVKGKGGLHFDDLSHILSPQKVAAPW